MTAVCRMDRDDKLQRAVLRLDLAVVAIVLITIIAASFELLEGPW